MMDLDNGNLVRCPCIYPDPDPDNEVMCACGDALDEHDRAGKCQAERSEP